MSRWDNFTHERITKQFSKSSSPLLGALLITLTLLMWTTFRQTQIALASWIWIMLVGTAAIVIYGRMPPRVMVPLILSATLASAFIMGVPRVKLRSTHLQHRLCLAFSILALLIGGVRVQTSLAGWLDESKINQKREAKLRGIYADLHALDPHGIFIHQPPGIRNESFPALSSGSDFPNLRFVWLGWQIGSPNWLDDLDALGIDDLYTAIAKREHTYLITTHKARLRIPSLIIFLKNHRGITFTSNPQCVDRQCRIAAWSAQRVLPTNKAKLN